MAGRVSLMCEDLPWRENSWIFQFSLSRFAEEALRPQPHWIPAQPGAPSAQTGSSAAPVPWAVLPCVQNAALQGLALCQMNKNIRQLLNKTLCSSPSNLRICFKGSGSPISCGCLPAYPWESFTASFVDAFSSSCNHWFCMFMLIFIILPVYLNSLVADSWVCFLNSILHVLWCTHNIHF